MSQPRNHVSGTVILYIVVFAALFFLCKMFGISSDTAIPVLAAGTVIFILAIRSRFVHSSAVLCIGLIFGLAIAMFSTVVYWDLRTHPRGGGKVDATAGDIGAFNSALALYQVDLSTKTDTGHFPLATLMQLYSDNALGWAGPYVATITRDPWANAYTYTSDGSNYTIQSVHDSDYDKAETIRYVFSTGVMESIP